MRVIRGNGGRQVFAVTVRCRLFRCLLRSRQQGWLELTRQNLRVFFAWNFLFLIFLGWFDLENNYYYENAIVMWGEICHVATTVSSFFELPGFARAIRSPVGSTGLIRFDPVFLLDGPDWHNNIIESQSCAGLVVVWIILFFSKFN